MLVSFEHCQERDHLDPLAGCRDVFDLPPNQIYLDGNSLGPMTHRARAQVQQRLQEWQADLIAGWSHRQWIDYPQRLGAKLAPLLGAKPHEVQVVDSTSLNLFKLACAAVLSARSREPARARYRIVTEQGNFPTVPYMLEGLGRLAADIQVDVVPREKLCAAMTDETALLVLTHAHYLSGEVFDLEEMTSKAHAQGIQILWDLSHSTGVLPLNLTQANVDFAVGCGYKYLNGGPGAPAFLYVREDLQAASSSVLSGWLGHREPFAFEDTYAPGEGLDRFRCGTPPVLAYAALEGALEIFEGLNIDDLRKKSLALSELLIKLLDPALQKRALTLVSPRDGALRGGHVSFAHPDAQRIMAALAQDGVVGDYRPPHFLRFGLSPLYLRYVDIWAAAEKITRQVDAVAA